MEIGCLARVATSFFIVGVVGCFVSVVRYRYFINEGVSVFVLFAFWSSICLVAILSRNDMALLISRVVLFKHSSLEAEVRLLDVVRRREWAMSIVSEVLAAIPGNHCQPPWAVCRALSLSNIEFCLRQMVRESCVRAESRWRCE